MGLTKLALKRPVSVIIVMLALVIFGAMSIATSPMELTPEMEMPMLIVMTTYPGAGPEDIEDLVSKKMEAAVSTLNGLKNVESISRENVSTLILEMEYGTNMDVTHMDLQEKLNLYSGQLPDTASSPMIIEMSMDQLPVIVLSASATGDVDLRYHITENIQPEFEKLGGVASVSVGGGKQGYISIQLMENRLRQYGLDMPTLVNILSSANFSLPAGSAEMGSQSLSVRSEVQYKTVQQLLEIPIPLRSGNVIHLSDVAQVFQTTQDAQTLSRYNGEDNVSLAIQKRQSASTLEVSRAVHKELNRINAQDLGVHLEVVQDSSDMIVDSVKSVFSTLLLGIALSMAVLFLFFGDFKASLIVGSSMPISLLVTVILMRMMGFSLNLVSLGGMVVGVGMMVDNSIVVIESCFRYSTGERPNFKNSALEGTKFVAASIVASTLTSVVVFLPISVLQGLSGQLFKQLGFTIIFSLTASLLCALTLVPLFFSIFKPKERRESPFSKFIHRLEISYGNTLSKILPYKKTVVFVSLVLLVGSIVLVFFLDSELMPSVDEGTVSVSIEARPGLQLDRIDQIISEVEQMAANHPDVERYTVSGGSAMQMGPVMGGSSGSASLTAYLRSNHNMTTAQVVEQWRKETRDMLDCEVTVQASGSAMGSMGNTGEVVINLQSNNFDQLRTYAQTVEEMMRSVDGVIRTSSSTSKGNPQAQVIVDPIKAASKGFQPVQIAQNVRMVLSGQKTITINQKGQEYDVIVEYPRDQYQTINDLSGLVMLNAAGQQIPLLDVASIEFSDSPQNITRQNNLYLVSITAQTTADAYSKAQRTIMQQLRASEMPDGISFATGGMAEQMMEEFNALIFAIAIATLLVFMVMAMQFESPKFSFMVMICVPFSLIGSFGLLWLTNCTISMPSLMGLLTLVGTVVNNGILFVDTANQYRTSMDMHTALINTGRTRLRPILMTTLTTILSMVPMAIGIGSGSEMMRGMAVVIIGGLTASTLLTLLLLPTFYILFEGKKNSQKQDKQLLKQHEETLQAPFEHIYE